MYMVVKDMEKFVIDTRDACLSLGLREGMAYSNMSKESFANCIPELLAVIDELWKQLGTKDAAIDELARGLYAKSLLIDKLEEEVDKLRINKGLCVTEDQNRMNHLENKVQSIEDWQVLHISKRHESLDGILDDLRDRVNKLEKSK